VRVMRFKSEIAQRELSDLGRDRHVYMPITPVADPLHFDSPTTRIIKSGSKGSLSCFGGIL
jgi:hypothetical protein